MLKRKIREFFSGVGIAKEYPCVDQRQFEGEVNVYLQYNGHRSDITHTHLFLGYKPLIAGIWFPLDIHAEEVKIDFVHRSGKTLANLRLKRFTSIQIDHNWLVIFTGLQANVYFLPLMNRVATNLLRRFRKRLQGNVEMEGNEYQQVQAMYSLPRKISVISLGEDGLYNMFPTDLHGNAGENFYVDSLRKAGKACQQVLDLKRIVKADIDIAAMNDAFAMGKNHMRDRAPQNNLPVEGTSERYRLPLPKGVVAYKELLLHHHIEIGIHRLLIFKVENEKVVHSSKPVLACTNGHYIQWRIDHSLPANYM